ncbi:FG-GAP repeat protein [Acidobacteriota bacterium]
MKSLLTTISVVLFVSCGLVPSWSGQIIPLVPDKASGVVYGPIDNRFRNGCMSSVLGDLNGDGKDDLVLGFGDVTPHPGRDLAGRAYVIYGRDPYPQVLDMAFEQPDVVIDGAEMGDRTGFAVLTADLNCDGTDDLIISSPTIECPAYPGTQCGQIGVFLGGALPAAIDLAIDTPDFTLHGEDPNDVQGQALASGDINGDLCDDLVIGSYYGTGSGQPDDVEAGEVYVFYGRSILPQEMNLSVGDADLTIYGGEAGDRIGHSLAVGNLDGDTYDDLIVGSWRAQESYVFFGGPTLSGLVDLRYDSPPLLIENPGNARFGMDVGMGDLNGDGVDDAFVGRPYDYDDGSSWIYPTYFIFYGRNVWPSVIAGADADSFVTLPEEVFGSYWSVPTRVTGWDLNQDGIDELVISSRDGHTENVEATDLGKVYIEFGSPSFPPELDYVRDGMDITLRGEAFDNAGGRAAAYGDLNGDGLADLVVCATNGDGPSDTRDNSGDCFVFLGNNCRVTANLSPPQPAEVCAEGTALVDGSSSTIVDCANPSYEWTIDGEVVAGATDPILETPPGLAPGVHTVRLTVSCEGVWLCSETSSQGVAVTVVDPPGSIARLFPVRGGADIEFSWDSGADAQGGYRLYAVGDKGEIPLADKRNPSAVLVGQTASWDETSIVEQDAFPGSFGGIAFYQAVGVCEDGITEGYH